MNGAELRERMANGSTVFGTMTMLVRTPRWAALYGNVGFDYVIVDTEHSPTGRSEASDLAVAFRGAGVCPILRVPTTEPHQTIMGLDAGFDGVLVPYCETAAEVRTIVGAARLRPLKGAQHDRARDAGLFPSDESRAYLAERNKDVVVIIGIESVTAVENLDAILDVGGIDAIFIGPNDLSISIGVPNQYDHPRFIEVTDHIIHTAQARGIPAGGHWQTEADVERWMARGSRFILFYIDAPLLQEGYRRSLNKFRQTNVGAMEETI
ncbi:MAG: aldolase/citrate lyase family protein [Chloroflexota bacterium]|nr:aldolase/citrate lyase family protein [Chloroflexota bacterium]